MIHFEKISAKNMQRMLNFLYVGHVALEKDDLDGFLETASEMGVTGISLQEYTYKLPMLNLSDTDKNDGEGKMDQEEDLDKICENLDPGKYFEEALISRTIPSGDIILDEDDNGIEEELDIDLI